jgi:cytochrome P450
MNPALKLAGDAPAHVPPELVRDFQFENLPGAGLDAVQAAADAVRGGPEIFYALNVRHGAQDNWVVTTHEMIREVFQNTELFSSKGGANFSALLGETWDLLPLEVDPPEHEKWRVVMNPVFSPKRMKAVEADIKATAARLVDGALAKGETEFVRDFSEVFPVTIFLSLMGLPLDQTAQFLDWENGILHSGEMDTRIACARAINDYLLGVIAERRKAPTDDLVSYILGQQIDGRAVTDKEALAICFLLFVAGLDTVTATLGFIFKHLAEHPEHQQQLRDKPELIGDAIEELMRAYPIVVSSRLVTRDVDFHGVKMKQGDRVTLATMLAGRDGTEFPNPDVVDFAREKVNHISFAAGPHRCIGSHLARREMRVAVEEWLGRVPPFRVKPGETPTTHAIGVFGVDYLPLVW